MQPTPSFIECDGSELEGGGQTIRNALSFAILTSQPVRIHNIRKSRKQPGLKLQNILNLGLLRPLAGGHIYNARIGSQELWFLPGTAGISAPTMETAWLDQTSGSAKMVFQSLLPVLIMKGLGAHVHFKNERSDPLFDYMQFIFLPFVNRHCGLQYRFDRDPIRGDIDLKIHPAMKIPKPFSVLNAGSVCSFVGVLWGNLTNDTTVSSALKEVVETGLKKFYPNIPITFLQRDVIHFGSEKVGALLYAETTEGYRIAATIEFDGLGLDNVKARLNYYGSKLIRKLKVELAQNGAVDEHLADQLIIYMALVTSHDISAADTGNDPCNPKNKHGRRCTIATGPVTFHTLTAMRISETFLGDVKFSVQDRDNGVVVTCEGRNCFAHLGQAGLAE